MSNDDGINASGIKVLEKIAKKLSDDVWVVAPESEQSGVSHSLTMHMPLRIRKLSAKKFAVSGTPTDSILLAVKKVMEKSRKKPSLVLSGINRGSNLGEDVTYSGTVAAAIEATLLGIPAVAISQCYSNGDAVKWHTAEHFIPSIIKKLMSESWGDKNTLININIPNREPSEVLGIRVVPQGIRMIGDKVTEREDPKGRKYYWIGSASWWDNKGSEGSDIETSAAGYITITPLHIDLTNHNALSSLEKSLNSNF